MRSHVNTSRHKSDIKLDKHETRQKASDNVCVQSVLCKMGVVMKWKKRNIDYLQIVNAQFVFTTIEGN